MALTRVVTRVVRSAARAMQSDTALAILLLVAVAFSVWTLVRWVLREGATNGPEDCAKKNKYWDEDEGKCMREKNCTKKGGKMANGKCVVEEDDDDDDDEGPEPVVTLFADQGFRGEQRQFVAGDYSDLGKFGFNDRTSSIKIPSSLKVTLYQKPNYSGEKLVLPSWNHADLTKWHFPSGNYNPNMLCLPSNSNCWNDSASSMKVTRA